MLAHLGVVASVAGAHGVPVLFVASDDKAVAEIEALLPGVATVTTKIGYSWNSALSKHPRRVLSEIEATVQAAVAQRATIKPFTLPGPLEVEIRHKRIDTADEACLPVYGWQRVDAYTVKRTIQALTDLF